MMLRAENLTLKRGATVVLSDIELTLQPGEVLGVLPQGEGVVDGWLDVERLQQVRAQLPALAHRVL